MVRLAVFAGALSLSGLAASGARACNAADFGAVVDQTAQALRDLNVNGAQRYQAKLNALRQKHHLSDQEIEQRAESLQDDKMSDFNREIEMLVGQMDSLSTTPNDKITCDKLEELKRVRDRLLTVMGQKSGYMLAKADIEFDRPSGAAPTPPKTEAREAVKPPKDAPLPTTTSKEDRLTPAPAPQAEQRTTAAVPPPPREEIVTSKPVAPEPPKEAARKDPPPALNPGLPARREGPAQTAKNWAPDPQPIAPPPAAERRQVLADNRNNPEPPTMLAPPPPGEPLPLPSDRIEATYSIDEIQEAGRGIFGTITAQFGGAINYAFQQFGRPNAYITGSEGGAAILAGLRYGKGTLHSKTAPESPIYWQGPSLGYDLGAEGSNALFLVYNLEDPNLIYGRFSGIGGSAYVAGGVGLNVLGKSGMVMVPIRSGIGLRLGANLAYLKFTERQTWNPF
ncbi:MULTISPECIES: DUF1134 domain-containing protein [Rhodomicrobium]|uniref:DUF1134 domain-containing protein n=1 Tax=Rhodomicrobium TaxID=1068 RepID=UPI000F747A18|nr:MULTISPECIES: DUF1134 domain-containing protein [Rhodomicrobium]